jgi:ribosomal protein L11 methyltransferase
MAWLSLKLAVDGDQADAISDALLEAGALSVSTEDRDAGTLAEEAQFGEPGLADPKSWNHNWVVALLDSDADVPALLASLNLRADIEHQVDTVAEQDWVRLTQSQFDPIRISQRLWIVPSWHEAPDVDAIAIVLDPGLAFGTGSHPTTRLCLQWLEANLQPGETVLDYGCGSGILAIAAAKLGAGRVEGVDIDPQAVEAARDNAERNTVQADFRLSGDSTQGGFDVVVANILTNPLKALMPLLAARARQGGRIILSGILEAQAGEVMAIYSAAFDMHLAAVDEGWVLLTGSRK